MKLHSYFAIACILICTVGCNKTETIETPTSDATQTDASPSSNSNIIKIQSWYELVTGQQICLTSSCPNKGKDETRSYTRGDRYPDKEPQHIKMWRPSDIQLHPVAYANPVDSDRPLNVPWRCTAERCPVSENAKPTIPKNAVYFREQAFCENTPFPLLMNIEDYGCTQNKDEEWVWQCTNPAGCNALLYRYGACDVPVNPGTFIDEVGRPTFSESYDTDNHLCQSGNCACGQHFCGQNEYCIDGNCWHNGAIYNQYGEFVFGNISGIMGSSDCGPDITVISCEREEGCWTPKGIHYPRHAIVGMNDDLAHDDSGAEYSDYCPIKRTDGIKPMGSDKSDKQTFFCDNTSCKCGTSTCHEGQICRKGTCEHITCQAPKGKGSQAKVWTLSPNYNDYELTDALTNKPDSFKNSARFEPEDVGYYGSDDVAEITCYDTRKCKMNYPPSKKQPDNEEEDESAQLNCDGYLVAEHDYVNGGMSCRCNGAEKPGEGFECLKITENSDPVWVCKSAEGCRTEKRTIHPDAIFSCSEPARDTQYGCYCSGKHLDTDTDADCHPEPPFGVEDYDALFNAIYNNEWTDRSLKLQYTEHYFKFYEYYKDLFHYYAFNVSLKPGETCEVSQGCMCGDQKCPMSGLCTENGCVDPLTRKAFTIENGYIQAGLYQLCAEPEGCVCGKDYCKEGAACLAGFCSPLFQAEIHDGKRYVNENIDCSRLTWDNPDEYACYADYMIEQAFFSDRSPVEYGTVRCAKAEGCQCGDTICPYHSECREGECFFDLTYEHEMCNLWVEFDKVAMSDTSPQTTGPKASAHFISAEGLCVCNGTLREPEFMDAPHLERYHWSLGYDVGSNLSRTWVCNNLGWQCIEDRCQCGDAICNKGSICLRPGVCSHPTFLGTCDWQEYDLHAPCTLKEGETSIREMKATRHFFPYIYELTNP